MCKDSTLQNGMISSFFNTDCRSGCIEFFSAMKAKVCFVRPYGVFALIDMLPPTVRTENSDFYFRW